LRFTDAEEAHHFHIDQVHFLQIQRDLRSVLLHLCLQFRQMLRAYPANQSNRRAISLAALFDPQGHVRRVERFTCERIAMLAPFVIN
jgi:hypothetical protein